VSEIKRTELEAFYQWAKGNKGRSANGGNEHMSAVRTMFKWGEKQEVIDLPFKSFPEICRTLSKPPRITDETLLFMAKEGANAKVTDMMLFGILEGLRPRELLNLKRTQIKDTPKGALIDIAEHKTSKRTNRSRSVPLLDTAREIINKHIASHPESEYVFLNRDGKPFRAKAYHDALHDMCGRLNIRFIRPYDLRHEYASRLGDNNTDVNVIASLMGHNDPRTCMRYINNNYEHHQKAMEEIEAGLQDVRNAGKAVSGQAVIGQLSEAKTTDESNNSFESHKTAVTRIENSLAEVLKAIKETSGQKEGLKLSPKLSPNPTEELKDAVNA